MHARGFDIFGGLKIFLASTTELATYASFSTALGALGIGTTLLHFNVHVDVALVFISVGMGLVWARLGQLLDRNVAYRQEFGKSRDQAPSRRTVLHQRGRRLM
jgi:hypothetical protein